MKLDDVIATKILEWQAGFAAQRLSCLINGRLVADCGSPLEIALAAAIAEWGWTLRCELLSLGASFQSFSNLGDCKSPELFPQFWFADHRFDFLFRMPGEIDVLIECDGHDFHERTADQAAKDRGLDRSVQQSGRIILRFTGREIYRDPMHCAETVWTIHRQRRTKVG